MTVTGHSSTDNRYTPTTETAPVAPVATEAPMQTEQRLLKALDADGNGRVSKDEFKRTAVDLMSSSRPKLIEAAASQREAKWNRRLERRFDRVDANHDGSIDAGEMAKALSATSEHRVRTDGRMSSRASVVEVAIRRYTANS